MEAVLKATLVIMLFAVSYLGFVWASDEFMVWPHKTTLVSEEESLYNFYLKVTHWAYVSVSADSEANCSSINIHT